MSKVRIGIAGVTGYGGQELLRLAARHPNAQVTVAMALAASLNPLAKSKARARKITAMRKNKEVESII